MAAMQARCPDHGEWSDGKGEVVQTPTGLEWTYSFPCCNKKLVIRAARSASPATPDRPIIPTQRDPRNF